MKRIILIVFLIVVLISASTSCGQPKASNTAGDAAVQTESKDTGASSEATAKDTDESSQDTDQSAPDSDQSAATDPTGIYKEKGAELSNYLETFTNSESTFEGPLGNVTDMASMSAQLDRVIINLALLNLPQYDILSTEDLSREEGTLMLSGNQGIREKNGDEIKFSSNKEYTEDLMSNKKGDKYSEQGVLNTKNNTLSFESKTERDGKVINRIVIEAVILKDGTYLLQYLGVAQPMIEGDPLETTAVFKHYNQKEYSAITADFDPKMEFTYDSIIGKGDVQTDAMASKYQVNGKFTVKDGTAAFSQK